MSGRIADDIRTAARAIRGSSWPLDMAQSMEDRADRLEVFAASLNPPIGFARWIEDAAGGSWCAIGDGDGFAAEGLPAGSLIYAYPPVAAGSGS